MKFLSKKITLAAMTTMLGASLAMAETRDENAVLAPNNDSNNSGPSAAIPSQPQVYVNSKTGAIVKVSPDGKTVATVDPATIKFRKIAPPESLAARGGGWGGGHGGGGYGGRGGYGGYGGRGGYGGYGRGYGYGYGRGYGYGYGRGYGYGYGGYYGPGYGYGYGYPWYPVSPCNGYGYGYYNPYYPYCYY